MSDKYKLGLVFHEADNNKQVLQVLSVALFIFVVRDSNQQRIFVTTTLVIKILGILDASSLLLSSSSSKRIEKRITIFVLQPAEKRFVGQLSITPYSVLTPMFW